MWQNILASSIVMIVFVVVVILIYYLSSYRNLKQQKDHYKTIHQDLAVGQKVLFLNGVYGTLTRVGKDTVDIKVKSGAVMEVSRYAVTKIID